MPLQKGDFVRITYTAKLDTGAVIETTDESVAREMGLHKEGATYGPRTLVLGANSAIPGLEEALLGKEAGARGSVTVPPEKGVGPRKPDRIETFTVARFPEPPYPGMEVSLEGRHGVVETVIGRRVRVDFNHPLAGKTLVYDYKIEERVEGPEKRLEALARMVLPVPAEASVQDSAGTVRLPAELPPNLPVGLFRLLAEQAFEHLDLKELRVETRFPNPKKQPPPAKAAASDEKPASTAPPPRKEGAKTEPRRPK
ncbi:MAG: peptidylprolyl isomerase [Halobacteria archaeon]